MSNPEYLVVFITAPSAEVAGNLAKVLVEEGFCACVNIVPGVRSIYKWEGKLCDDSEVLMVVKTTSDRVEGLTEKVIEHHPYNVPEVIALPIISGSEPYLTWVKDSVA